MTPSCEATLFPKQTHRLYVFPEISILPSGFESILDPSFIQALRDCVSASDLSSCFGNQNIWDMLFSDGTKLKPDNNQNQNAFRLWIEGEYDAQEHILGINPFP